MPEITKAWEGASGTVEERLSALQKLSETRDVSVQWRAVRVLALRHLRWAFIVIRARGTPTVPPKTAEDMAILAAINAVSMDDSVLVEKGLGAAAFMQGLAALEQVGDITDELKAEISALFVEDVLLFPNIGLPDLHERRLISDKEAGMEVTDG